MDKAPRVKKTAPFNKMKANPPEQAKPVELGPCSQDDEKEAGEDVSETTRPRTSLGQAGTDLQVPVGTCPRCRQQRARQTRATPWTMTPRMTNTLETT